MTYASDPEHARSRTSGSSARRRSSVRGTATREEARADSRSTTSSPAIRPSTGAAAYVVAPITYLMGNDYEKVDLEGLDLTIGTAEEPKTATLERVWIDDPRPRAGRTVPLKVLLPHLSRRGRPPHAADRDPRQRERHAVAAGLRRRAAGQAEQREARSPQQLRSVDQLIRALNKARRNNTLYVKLLGSDAGAVVNGELLSSLPPSVLAVLEGRPERRQLQPAAQRHARRVGAADRARRQRLAHADDHRLAELSRTRSDSARYASIC